MAFVKFRTVGDDDAIWIEADAIIAAREGGRGPDDEDTTQLHTGPGNDACFWVVGTLGDVVQRLAHAKGRGPTPISS